MSPPSPPHRVPLPAAPPADRRLLAVVLALLPPLLLWPLPLVGLTDVLAAPEFEAAAHAWGLWAALHEGSMLPVETDLLAFPDGVRFPLVDPGHLPPFALGAALARATGGVAVAGGYAAVAWWGLLAAGVGGALLAREVGGHRAVGAAAAMAAPAILCSPGDGLTEDLAVGWVAVQLGLLLRFARTGSAPAGVGAAFTLALTAWTGPYHGLFAALLDTAVGLALLVRDRRAGLRALAVGAGAVVLVLPLAEVLLGARDSTAVAFGGGGQAGPAGGMPGSAGRAGLPPVDEALDRWRGGITTSIDMLDPWLPRQLTGAVPPVTHTGYLGLLTLGLSALALVRERRRWPWAVGAGLFLTLALGPYLYVQGRALAVDGVPVLAPAGHLATWVPGLDRLTRWYRAAGVAALLLVPLVARGAVLLAARLGTRGNLVAPAVVGGLVLESLVLAPLPWPHPHAAVPEQAAWALLPSPDEEPGAVMELPLTTAGSPPTGQWRDISVLAQTLHQRPVGGTVMGLRPSDEARRARHALSRLVETGYLSDTDHQYLLDTGFAWLAVRTRYHGLPPSARAHLDACLGPPVVDDTAPDSDGLRIHRIPAPAASCGVDPGPGDGPRQPR